jgi:hypothetical protein
MFNFETIQLVIPCMGPTRIDVPTTGVLRTWQLQLAQTMSLLLKLLASFFRGPSHSRNDYWNRLTYQSWDKAIQVLDGKTVGL